jgi:ribose transport system permease protein/inositol transport system permease protein
MIELSTFSRQNNRPRVNDLISFFQRYGLFIFLFLLVIFSAIASPHFLSAENVEDLLNQAAPLGVVVIGQTFVILTGGLDLSVASLMATVAVITTSIGKANDAMVIPIFIISIVIAIVVGMGNGWLVTKRKVSPFLATLAMMIVLQGLRFAYTKGAPSGMLPPMFRLLGTGSWFGIPINLIALAILAAVFALILYRTSYGRMLYLTGGNKQAAFHSGIAVDRIVIAAYIICAITAALGGLFLVGYTGSIDNWVGRGYELDSIAAVIMGGASFKGGQGGIFGALAGAIVLVIIFNLVLLLGLPVQAQMIVKGLVIILASAFYLSRSC